MPLSGPTKPEVSSKKIEAEKRALVRRSLNIFNDRFGLMNDTVGLGLESPHLLVVAVVDLDQEIVLAFFDDPPVLHDDDPVHLLDGGKPMGDGDDGAAAHEFRERVLDIRFGLRVETRGGFVEDEDRGIHENGPSDGDTLPFAARELHAPFPDERFVALGE